MRKIALIAISTLVLYSCAVQEKVPTNTTSESSSSDTVIVKPFDFNYDEDSVFSVLSWNVEHFIDSHDDPYIDNERENNPPENMALRVKLLLESLKKADADIVVFQEFESAKFLKQLANDSLPEMNYLYFADIPSHNWYMNVVVMSKFPMGVIRGYGAATTPLVDYKGENGLGETQNQINTRMWSIDIFPSEDYSFLLTGVHLKAGRSERDEAMRKGQLNLLVSNFNEILNAFPSQNMMVTGDLNAYPSSEELALLKNNKWLKNQFVDQVDSTIYSHPANNPSRRLDYMLVNENMSKEVVSEGIKVENFFSPDTMRIISDHLPVMGTFYTRDK
ncbi:endonuclease/exonuclease/phosphatase family protein [Algoriphagus aquimarinus]|mgnify:FL=1|uniref:endonuclease/exonuclease/phosphatase family protein n=1 Tax=Algoriphagus aquimarinus TaxID=237018 RepID=UPI0030D9C549